MSNETSKNATLGPASVRVCAFDAYGTLFDVNSAAKHARDELGERWQPLADLWRTKQLQYTWLRSLMGQHADFWQVTGDALDFALAELKLTDEGLRERLMQLYLELDAYPEVKGMLKRLKSSAKGAVILSNGSPDMLAAAVRNAGLEASFDAVLSVEQVGIYKPHPSVYRMVVDRFNVVPTQVCFVSSNAWDAHAAKVFGFNVVWCNRFKQSPERMPGRPDAEISTLAELPGVLGIA